MSSITWTPPAVAEGAAPLRRSLWRAVEAQHIASTLRLTDSLAEQALLEEILEAAKPPLPPEARPLHYLLATPFRYPPPPEGSRFRGPADPGVLYGADERCTACAELGYWRWRFVTDSEGLGGLGPTPHTLFRAGIDTTGVDLREAPFARDAAFWTDPADYAATQAFARAAREACLGAIRYRSVRDPRSGACTAVLRPDAFRPLRPLAQESWLLTVTRTRVAWQRDGQAFEFEAARWQPA